MGAPVLAAIPAAMGTMTAAKVAAPAIGAALGAATNRDNPLMGAVMGGVGGHFAGPMLGKAAGAPGGLLGNIDPAKAMMQGGKMMMGGQNQPQPMAATAVPPPQAQFNRGSFQSLGQGQNMYQPFNTRR